MTSRQGQILIASRLLLDPNFVKTVVLIVQDGEDGVVGLILNRPLEVSVADACGPGVEAAAGVEQFVHQGGPCPGPLMVLHGGEDDLGGDEVIAGVRFTAQRDEIEHIMESDVERVRYFANYAGWGAAQLENELNEGAWVVAPGNADDVFADGDEALWSRLMTRVTLGRWVDTDIIPDDPSMN